MAVSQRACLQVCKNFTMQVLVKPASHFWTTRNESDISSKSIGDSLGIVWLWIRGRNPLGEKMRHSLVSIFSNLKD